FSTSSQIRPAINGIRRMPKYPGLIRFTDAFCCSAAGCPRISNRESQPFQGGVALLEIAAMVTPGVSATFARNCSKKAPRAAHVVGILRKDPCEARSLSWREALQLYHPFGGLDTGFLRCSSAAPAEAKWS